MAKKAYIGVGDVAKRVGKMYVGVDGVARKIKKAYIGVNGIARLFYNAAMTKTVTETITVYPSEADRVLFESASNMDNPVGKGSSNTTYATINLRTGSGVHSSVRYPFDFSSIPDNATIDSISCKAKGYISNTSSSDISTRQMQLYTGDFTKGSAVDLTTSATAQALTCGTWTRAELQNCSLRLYAVRGTSNTSTNINMRFYGAEITVTYTYEIE